MAEECGRQVSAETQRWIEDRRRPGNWFSIAADDELPRDIVTWEITLLHMFQIAFSPELEKRAAEGRLAENFQLISAQWLGPDEGRPIIRINDEVRGVSLIRLSRTIEKGDPIFLSDLDDMISFDVAEDELDCSHFTIFWTGKGWKMFFNFQAGRAKSAQMIGMAQEFLASSKYSAGEGHSGASTDALFSACELLSKAHLILHRSRAATAKTHGSVNSAINQWRRLGNIDSDFVELFNRMGNRREDARYRPGTAVPLPTAEEFEIVDREVALLDQTVAHRTKEHVEGEQKIELNKRGDYGVDEADPSVS